ncbi:hypothetical protein AVEN_110323-1 [Araneus ventricosus]|uniref:Uncharacterized protein n=1 Tax=Araneus ventricosus TaxID=182803 RepID=A0A4Y2T3I3_ARAVE|nr:hypothetical protein AVEN_110323-1 [Araneus ventricosus]
MQIGDRKPSRLLFEMRSKAENKIREELLKSLFLQRLPSHVQQILAISNDELGRLAEMVDGIMAAATDTVAIQAVTSEEANYQTTLMEDHVCLALKHILFPVPGNLEGDFGLD